MDEGAPYSRARLTAKRTTRCSKKVHVSSLCALFLLLGQKFRKVPRSHPVEAPLLTLLIKSLLTAKSRCCPHLGPSRWPKVRVLFIYLKSTFCNTYYAGQPVNEKNKLINGRPDTGWCGAVNLPENLASFSLLPFYSAKVNKQIGSPSERESPVTAHPTSAALILPSAQRQRLRGQVVRWEGGGKGAQAAAGIASGRTSPTDAERDSESPGKGALGGPRESLA